MCYASSSTALSRLGLLWGLLALVTLLTAFVSNVWLFTREPMKYPNSEQHTTVTFKIGLWRVCPSIKKTNISTHVSSPSCSLVNYSNWDEVKHTDLGIATSLDFTPAFISKMRISMPFEAASVILMLLATMFALVGHCNGDHKTLIACGLYILGGLSLGGGLVVFASVLSDAYFDRPRRTIVIAPLVTPGGVNPFDYRYGWSFFAAGAAVIMAELAGLLSITAYLRRFPTVEDMVRVMVPGADRHLRRYTGSECLVRHPSYRRRQNGPPNIWSGNAEYFGTKSEPLAPCELEGVDGPLLLSNSAPDICSANPKGKEKKAPINTEVQILNEDCPISEVAHLSEKVKKGLQEYDNALMADRIKKGLHDYDNVPLAGVTVPITLMRQNNPKNPDPTQIPAPFAYNSQTLNRYGHSGHSGVLHQGVLGVSEGASTSSNSSGGTTGSCHSSVGKYSTLQPQHRKKNVAVSTFSTLDTYDAAGGVVDRGGIWSNSEV